ncbi:MAG TPA: hypothetical protein VL132_07395, partial [Planctomycetaceae bacterium]|nr:hypothetical protein [Planctomycetaceae bacterium]
QLGKPGRTKPGVADVPFEARPTIPDLDWAGAAIKSLDLGPPAATRTADLLADEGRIQSAAIDHLKRRFSEIVNGRKS